MQKHILLYEPDHTQIPHLLFLLRLRDNHCTHARSAEEALNWLSANRLQVVTFDLVLIGSVSHQPQEMQFFEEICGLSLPVIFIQRDQEKMPESLQSVATACNPDHLLGCISDHETVEIS